MARAVAGTRAAAPALLGAQRSSKVYHLGEVDGHALRDVDLRIEDDLARERAVRIGERGTEWAQVLDGLAEGDRVVPYPSDRVADGTLVRAR